MDIEEIRRNIARRVRRNRVAEGFRNNEELVEAMYTQLKVLVEPIHLEAIEGGKRDCPAQLLALLAVFYDCSMDTLAGIVPLSSSHGVTHESALAQD